jgi:hypothetical protein
LDRAAERITTEKEQDGPDTFAIAFHRITDRLIKTVRLAAAGPVSRGRQKRNEIRINEIFEERKFAQVF